MTGGSLRLRLFLAAIASVALALIVAGTLLIELFDRHVSRRVDSELESHLRQLAGAVDFREDGRFVLTRDLSDARFGEPFSGLYWQIEDDGTGQILSSRSLWDTRIPLAPDTLDIGGIHHHRLPGPDGSMLRVQERGIVFELPSGNRTLRMAVAIDDGEIAAARASFAAELWPSLVVLGVVLLAAAWVQITIGLRPMETVRRGVQAIRSGGAKRLENHFPKEVSPLVDEVNDLLAAQERNLAKARARAADLAHGLKTPLTVLQGDADRLRRSGVTDLADELEDLARTMRLHVDRELARTRMRGPDAVGRQDTPLARTTMSLVQALQRTPHCRAIAWDVSVPENLSVALDSHDLTELLGNILDNACKWARSGVRITAGRENGQAVVAISDDGPGVPDADLTTLTRRGLKLDEKMPGSGIGLAIVQDILDANDAHIAFANIADGGLRVTLHLPLAANA